MVGPLWKSAWSATPDQWLGFLGGVIGGLAGGAMTLVAAVVAWRSVQQQVIAQREIAERQGAVQRFEILSRQASVIEDEMRHAFKLGGLALQTKMIDELRKTSSDRAILVLAILPKYKELLRKLEAAHEEWEISSTRSVNFLGAMQRRLEFEDKIQSILQSLGPAIAVLEVLALRANQQFGESEDEMLQSIEFEKIAEAAYAARQHYVQQLIVEMQPIYAAIHQARQRAGM
jgi:hypothetical protein